MVLRVVDTAEALFEVDDYEDFVRVQSEAALRNLASRHPCGSEACEMSLHGGTTEIGEQLKPDIQERLQKAGVQVIEARISHLAYALEIAAAMLQRQQPSFPRRPLLSHASPWHFVPGTPLFSAGNFDNSNSPRQYRHNRCAAINYAGKSTRITTRTFKCAKGMR